MKKAIEITCSENLATSSKFLQNDDMNAQQRYLSVPSENTRKVVKDTHSSLNMNSEYQPKARGIFI
jgi:hypothetical protein